MCGEFRNVEFELGECLSVRFVVWLTEFILVICFPVPRNGSGSGLRMSKAAWFQET